MDFFSFNVNRKSTLPTLCWEKPVISLSLDHNLPWPRGHTDCVALGTKAGAAAAAAVERTQKVLSLLGTHGWCLKAWTLGFHKALQVLSICTDSTPRHERTRVGHSAMSDSLRPHGL